MRGRIYLRLHYKVFSDVCGHTSPHMQPAPAQRTHQTNLCKTQWIKATERQRSLTSERKRKKLRTQDPLLFTRTQAVNDRSLHTTFSHVSLSLQRYRKLPLSLVFIAFATTNFSAHHSTAVTMMPLSNACEGSDTAELLKQYQSLKEIIQARPATFKLPLPARADVKGTWAYDTIHRRIREEILARVFQENADFLMRNPWNLKRLQLLDSDLRASFLTPLRPLLLETESGSAREDNPDMRFAASDSCRLYPKEVEDADTAFWNERILTRPDTQGTTWATAPWLVSELYFYRRISEAFDHLKTGYDPFSKQKKAGLVGSRALLVRFAEAYRRMLHSSHLLAEKEAEQQGEVEHQNIGEIKVHSKKEQSSVEETTEMQNGTYQINQAESSGLLENSYNAQKCVAEEREPILPSNTEYVKHEATALEEVEHELQSEFSTMKSGLRSAVLAALNGNAADLSLWPVDSDSETEAKDKGQETRTSTEPEEENEDESHLLADDFDKFFAAIAKRTDQAQKKRLQQAANGWEKNITKEAPETAYQFADKKEIAYFFVDNAGSEVLTDMWLACVLLEYKVVDKVVFYTKQYPIFVSDALPKDFKETFDWVLQEASSQNSALATMVRQWISYVESGKWVVKSHVYFTLPYEYAEMPCDLYEELKTHASFIISKGDANYRRIIGDRTWPFQTPFDQVAGYFPCPLLALRKLKADVACGILLEKQQHAEKVDSKWMVNGKWGVLQYFDPHCDGH